MRYLFDASAIFSALRPDTVWKLAGNYTIELAKYEVGNIIWKEKTVHKRMDDKEQGGLLDLAASALKTMQILKIDGHEIYVLKLASEINDSFYDASYVHFAAAMKIPLVTGDQKLSKKIKDRVAVKALSEI